MHLSYKKRYHKDKKTKTNGRKQQDLLNVGKIKELQRKAAFLTFSMDTCARINKETFGFINIIN